MLLNKSYSSHLVVDSMSLNLPTGLNIGETNIATRYELTSYSGNLSGMDYEATYVSRGHSPLMTFEINHELPEIHFHIYNEYESTFILKFKSVTDRNQWIEKNFEEPKIEYVPMTVG